MPIKVRYNKQDFLVSDGVKTLEDLLIQLANTPLKDVCPKHFYLFYFDDEGDKIVLSSTEDLLSFVEYCSTNSMSMVVALKSCESGKGALQLKQAKPINEVVQEELQKQLEASVMRLRQEMTETVKQLVEEQTKDFQLTQSMIKPKTQTEGIPSFFEVLEDHITTFQELQSSLLAQNQDFSNVNTVFDNLADCIKDITLAMKNHVQNLKKEVKSRREQQALLIQENLKKKEEKSKKTEEKAKKDEEKLKKEKKKDQKEKEKEKEKKESKEKVEKKEKKEKKTLVDVIQTQPAPQSEIKEAPKEAVNEPQQEQVIQVPQPQQPAPQEPAQSSQIVQQPQQPQPAQENQPQIVENQLANFSRARDLSQLFGFEQSVVYALIVQNPQQTDDEIMNQLLDQFK